MNKNDIISVIIPNYNTAVYLKDCIESIVNQSYKNIEIVIADDCSTDDSKEIIELYKKKYSFIKSVYNGVNRGVAYNRHSAILEASGKYLTTIDSDDVYYNKKKLENEINILKQYESKGVENICAFSRAVLLDRNLNFKKIRSSPRQIKQGRILSGIYGRSCEIPLDFLMKKKDYLQVGGYDFSLNIYEDWDLKIRLSKELDFIYTGEIGTGYRRHSKGLSSSNFKQHYYWLTKVFKKNFNLLNSKMKIICLINFSVFLIKMRIRSMFQ